jgi:hypothetical protein
VGVGDPLEASYRLAGPIDAGVWRLIGDGIVLADVDVRFEIIWKAAGGAETVIVAFDHHFDRPEGDDAFRAVPFDGEATAPAIDAASGDTLTLRITAVASPRTGPVFIPNADGELAGGRIPSIALPGS